MGHDSVSFDRFCKLGFLRKTSHAQKHLQPLCESWTFDPADIKKGLYTSVASSLEGQSLKKFKLLTFDTLTQQALGISVPEILDFHLRYQLLNARIYDYFIKRRHHVQHLVKVKKVCSPTIPHSPVPKKKLIQSRSWTSWMLILSYAL